MFHAEIPGGESEDAYEKICVDDRTFYRRRADSGDGQSPPAGRPPKRARRYSDRFKDPVFEQRETVRKLRMLEKFREKNADLDKTIEAWKECIGGCIDVLWREHEISPRLIFDTFGLRRYGFRRADFDMESEEDEECERR